MPYLTEKQAAQLVIGLGTGERVQALADKYKITYQAAWAWKRYIGLDTQWLKHVRDLEKAYRVLNRHQAETDKLLKIAVQVIKQFAPSPRLRGLMATAVRSRYGLRRIDANRILGISYSAGSAKCVRKNDAALVATMREYLVANPGQGFNTMFGVLLRGSPNSRPLCLKLYQEHRLQMQYRKQGTLPRRVHNPMAIQSSQDKVWSMDFMMGVLPDGSRFSVLNAIDDFNRECMFNVVTARSSTKAVIGALTDSIASGRKPLAVRTDNGGEFTSNQYAAWTAKQGITRRFIRPGQSQENAYVESFNNTVRREVLNAYEFRTTAEVQRMLDDWRIRYNLARPHKALGGLSPVQYAYATRRAALQT